MCGAQGDTWEMVRIEVYTCEMVKVESYICEMVRV